MCLAEAFGLADQPSAIEEQAMANADFGVEMGCLSIEEGASAENVPLLAEKSEQRKKNYQSARTPYR